MPATKKRDGKRRTTTTTTTTTARSTPTTHSPKRARALLPRAREVRIHRELDACELHKYARAVTGLPSESASMTDTWLVDVRGEPFGGHRRLFLKIFVTQDTQERMRAARDAIGARVQDPRAAKKKKTRASSVDDNLVVDKDLRIEIESLEYERRVYTQLTRRLLIIPVCPLFVRIHDFGSACGADAMLALLARMDAGVLDEWMGVLPQYKKLTRKQRLRHLLWRNSLFLANGGRSRARRPAIDDATFPVPRDARAVSAFFSRVRPKYNFIATEALDARARTLHDHMWDHYEDIIDGRATRAGRYAFLAAFLQALVAVYAMHSVSVYHNDLHLDNIYMVPVSDKDDHKETRTTTTYLLDGRAYSFRHAIYPKVYDFDRAYDARGDNPKLLEVPEYYSQSNHAIDNRDMVKLLCYAYAQAPTRGTNIKRDIYRLFVRTGAPAFRRELEDKYGFRATPRANPCFMGTREAGKMPNEYYTKHFYTSTEIIANCYNLMNKYSDDARADLVAESRHVFCLRGELGFASLNAYIKYRLDTIALFVARTYDPASAREATVDLFLRNEFYDGSVGAHSTMSRLRAYVRDGKKVSAAVRKARRKAGRRLGERVWQPPTDEGAETQTWWSMFAGMLSA